MTTAAAAGQAPGSNSDPTYSEVVQGASPGHEQDTEWRVATRRKHAKAPVLKKPDVSAAAPSSGSVIGAVQQRSRPAAKKVVIGSRTIGPFKAVAAVKRLSVFMSRLPPGTGEEAVKDYVKEQTGAEDVTAVKLQTRYDSYESYRLDIINASCENVLDSDLWAQGL